MRVEYHPAIEKNGDTMMSTMRCIPPAAVQVGHPVAGRACEIRCCLSGLPLRPRLSRRSLVRRGMRRVAELGSLT
jgi:hypothetical protein